MCIEYVNIQTHIFYHSLSKITFFSQNNISHIVIIKMYINCYNQSVFKPQDVEYTVG